MLKKNSLHSGFFTLRLVGGFVLVALGLSLALISYAANPSGGTITPTGPTVTWTGTGTGAPPAANGEGDRTDTQGC